MAASLTKTQSYTKPWEIQASGTALTVTLVTDDYLWIRQTLETTDPAVTPSLNLLEVSLFTGSPIIETLPATAVTETTATLNGDLISLGQESEIDVFFQWKEQGAAEWSTTIPHELTEAGTFDADLTGLTGGEDYEFRAVAEFGESEVVYGEILGFRTEDLIVDIEVKGIGRTEVETVKTPLSKVNIEVKGIGKVDYDLQRINIYPFEFEVKGIGKVDYSFLIIVDPQVATLDAVDITPTSAKLRGEVIIIGLLESIDVYFKWREHGENEWNDTPSQEVTELGIFEYNLEGLDTNRLYEFKAVVAW